jgi:hypothetical protein
VTPFFVPGVAGDAAEDAYDELRAYTARRTGRFIRATRIYSLNSRRDGADTQTRVGETDPSSGQLVRAIFATADGYTVTWEGGHADLTKRQIYEAVPFD